jgi:hypothetical protein
MRAEGQRAKRAGPRIPMVITPTTLVVVFGVGLTQFVNGGPA